MAYSPKTAEFIQDLSGSFNLIRNALAHLGEVEPAQERAALGREIQATCELLSQAGARARRDAVRAMRDDEGLTQDQIASAIGVSRPRVSEMLKP